MTGGQYKLPSWRRCNERLIGSCKDTASGCCGAMVCNLCLIKNEGTEDEELGSAVESAGEYTGDFGFFGYWRRAYGDDSCEFVVEIDGEEVGSFPKCEAYGDGMDCRKLEGVVEYGYDTLRFKYSRPLQLKHHREGKCKSNFCGACSCTNRFICFAMTGPEGCSFSSVIEYDEAYDLCEDETEMPRWYVEADCGYFLYEGWISLERDQYTGDCLLRVPGLDEPIEITDCKPLTVEWEIANEDDPYSPYQMSIVGTDCGTCEPPPADGIYTCPNCPDLLPRAFIVMGDFSAGFNPFRPEQSCDECQGIDGLRLDQFTASDGFCQYEGEGIICGKVVKVSFRTVYYLFQGAFFISEAGLLIDVGGDIDVIGYGSGSGGSFAREVTDVCNTITTMSTIDSQLTKTACTYPVSITLLPSN